MHPQADVDRARALAAAGRSATEIARTTRIPRSTIRGWLAGARSTPAGTCSVCGRRHPFDELPEAEYAYLLGMYLGDGHISLANGRCYRLRVTSDAAHPGVAAACAEAMRAVMPSSRVTTRARRDVSALEISSYGNAWPCLFPQHGPGRSTLGRLS